MNDELKQRLIGAIVVTALAAIFIPMLFDDTIDTNGQSVTELNIPSTPISTGEVSSNKLPTNANQVLNKQDAEPETTVNTNEESELSSETIPPAEAEDENTGNTSEQTADEEDGAPITLDTGIVNGNDTASKTPKTNGQKENAKLRPLPDATLESNTLVDAPIKAPKKPLSATKAIFNDVQSDINNTIATDKSVNTPTKAKSEFNRWTIQAGSFSKKENAITLMESLRKQGLPVTLDTITTSNNNLLYRLKIGPTLDKKHAADMKAKLDNQKIQSFITED